LDRDVCVLMNILEQDLTDLEVSSGQSLSGRTFLLDFSHWGANKI
jgi:hypothetical protein